MLRRLWQHKAVTKLHFRCGWMLFCSSTLLCVAFAISASGQTKDRHREHPNIDLQELQQRINAQHAATQSGDPAAVAQSSQKLVAMALRKMAQLRSQEMAWPQMIALYRASLALEDSPETSRELEAALLKGKRSNNSESDQDPTAGVSALALACAHLSAAQAKQLQDHEIELRRILADGYNDWGTAEARQQLYAQALLLFHQAEHWDASTSGLMRNIGNAAFRMGDFSESARAFELAVLAEPADQQSRLMLAMSLFSVGEYAQASKDFASVDALAMQDPRAAYAWAFSLAKSNGQQQANEIAGKLATEQLPAEKRMLVCQIYNMTENYEHAASCFESVSAQDPNMQRAHSQAAAALIRLDRPAQAIPELRAELKLTPDDADAQYYLAYALLQTSHKDEALALLRNVVSKQPDYAQAQYQLGKVMLEDSKLDEAIQHLEAAARLQPNAAYVLYQLQTAYRRAGRITDANRELALYSKIKAEHREVVPQQGIQGP